MAENEEKVEIDDNDTVPYFKIGSQRFASGVGVFEPETIIPWAVPETWREDLNGPHYATRPPSITWTPLNKAAKKLHAAQVERVSKMTAPPVDPSVARMEKLENAFTALATAQAEQTRVLTAVLEKLGKK